MEQSVNHFWKKLGTAFRVRIREVNKRMEQLQQKCQVIGREVYEMILKQKNQTDNFENNTDAPNTVPNQK